MREKKGWRGGTGKEEKTRLLKTLKVERKFTLVTATVTQQQEVCDTHAQIYACFYTIAVDLLWKHLHKHIMYTYACTSTQEPLLTNMLTFTSNTT